MSFLEVKDFAVSLVFVFGRYHKLFCDKLLYFASPGADISLNVSHYSTNVTDFLPETFVRRFLGTAELLISAENETCDQENQHIYTKHILILICCAGLMDFMDGWQ